MTNIHCQYRTEPNASCEHPVCSVVAELTERPLGECHVNDSACSFCLKCGVAPHHPNSVTASMAIGVANRSGSAEFLRRTLQRMSPYLTKTPPPLTKCILRGPEVRTVPCTPCQAGGHPSVTIPVYRCPKHVECTLYNTGIHPRIKACATCEERLEEPYQLEAHPTPRSVVEQIRNTRQIKPPPTT